MRPLLVVVLATAVLAAGCSASGASASNFELTPERVGWFAGDEARFSLNMTSTLLRDTPAFTIDRRFAIEEIRFDERGVAIGGDHDTRDPDSVGLRLLSPEGNESEEWTLDADAPGIIVAVTLPESLRDSEYVLELKLFKVGWVKSEPFRVDRHSSSAT